MVGTVKDPSGVVVPNAAVTITNTDKNQVNQITSRYRGQFVMPDLLIGHYGVPWNTACRGAENSHYNALQVNLYVQVHKDLTLQVAYTLSRVIDPDTTAGQLRSGRQDDHE